MLELAFTACSLWNPTHCREFSLVFADVTPIQCQIGVGTQIEMAKWKQGHPAWRISKWRCQEAGQFAKL